MNHDRSPHPPRLRLCRSRYALALLILGGAGLVFLLSQHRAHLLGALPLLLVLSCPLMHLFMHRGHGHAHGPRGEGDGRTP